MPKLKSFKGLRPPKNLVEKIQCRPYDVINSKEAREDAKGNKYSLLHITKAEIDFEEELNVKEDSEEVFEKALQNFNEFKEKKWLIKDNEPKLYIYGQTMNERTQYGIVGCAYVEDYLNGKIKKHEFTRKEKEDERMKHIKKTNANMEPVFFAYKENEKINEIVNNIVKEEEPIYNFICPKDGFGHQFWVINDSNIIKEIERIFEEEIDCFYIADGHHRSAAAVRIGIENRNNNNDEYNYFLTVAFPSNQLRILDYNRVIKDLNHLNKEEFIKKLEEKFIIENKRNIMYKPEAIHTFSMYLDNEWYKLTTKNNIFDKNNLIDSLDVNILSKNVLDKILGIKDLRTDKRIDFIGGIRGLNELKRRVDSEEMKVAFALYPVSMNELMAISDNNEIMPPKSTWFEPKLASGLVIHEY
jgi:uncharacterized protein (DUF1015 family)